MRMLKRYQAKEKNKNRAVTLPTKLWRPVVMLSIWTRRMIWERLKILTLHPKNGKIVKELSLSAREASPGACDTSWKICKTWSRTPRWSRRWTERTLAMSLTRCVLRNRATTACSLSNASKRICSCGYPRALSAPPPNSSSRTSTRATNSSWLATAWSTVDRFSRSTRHSMARHTCVWWKSFCCRCLTLQRIIQRANHLLTMCSPLNSMTIAFGSALIRSWTSTRKSSQRRMILKSWFSSRLDPGWPYSLSKFSMGR